jgi:hypothetical protein
VPQNPPQLRTSEGTSGELTAPDDARQNSQHPNSSESCPLAECRFTVRTPAVSCHFMPMYWATAPAHGDAVRACSGHIWPDEAFLLPCRRSWVRIPSAALRGSPANAGFSLGRSRLAKGLRRRTSRVRLAWKRLQRQAFSCIAAEFRFRHSSDTQKRNDVRKQQKCRICRATNP